MGPGALNLMGAKVGANLVANELMDLIWSTPKAVVPAAAGKLHGNSFAMLGGMSSSDDDDDDEEEKDQGEEDLKEVKEEAVAESSASPTPGQNGAGHDGEEAEAGTIEKQAANGEEEAFVHVRAFVRGSRMFDTIRNGTATAKRKTKTNKPFGTAQDNAYLQPYADT